MKDFVMKWYKLALLCLAIILIGFLIVFAIKNNKVLNGDGSGIQSVEDGSNADSTIGEDSSDSGEDTKPADGELTYADELDAASTAEEEGDLIFLFPKEDVASFSMTDSNGILLDFFKKSDDWYCLGYEEMDIDESRIDNILNYICEIKYVEAYDTEDGEAYGLNQESRMYIVDSGENSSVIISLGNVNEDGSMYFALNYDFTKIYKNSGKLYNVGEYAIEDLLQL